MSEIVKVLPSLLIVIGWLVLYSNQKRIEGRKEVKSIIDLAIDLVGVIYDQALKYYDPKQNTESVGALSFQIKSNLLLISLYLMMLSECGVKVAGLKELIEFRKLVTGDPFETIDYHAGLANKIWMASLTFAKSELILALNKSYFRWTKVL